MSEPLCPALDEAFRRRVQIPLAEVAELTGFPLGPLVADCRGRRLAHQYRSGKYFMTRIQVENLIASCARPRLKTAAPPIGADGKRPPIDLEIWKARTLARLARKTG